MNKYVRQNIYTGNFFIVHQRIQDLTNVEKKKTKSFSFVFDFSFVEAL